MKPRDAKAGPFLFFFNLSIFLLSQFPIQKKVFLTFVIVEVFHSYQISRLNFLRGTLGVQGEEERLENFLNAWFFKFFVNSKHFLRQFCQEIVKFNIRIPKISSVKFWLCNPTLSRKKRAWIKTGWNPGRSKTSSPSPKTSSFFFSLATYFHLWEVKWSVPFHFATAWKVSVFGVFLVSIFPHSDWIRRDMH